jgi:hypothetical protein
MWRGGDTSAEMKVYITTTVNFGDKPAGCIAIAAARETAAMDEGKFREAAWFLQNRTYVDDTTAGADSMERLEALSGEMEAVAKRGGLEFKETLMSGDKEDESGEPRKVLGLIWETEADRLKVDVELNLGAKKAGLHLMENIELNEGPEKALPEVITKRELWRVAQGQYDPLGLLCTFTIRFKILMRSIVSETSQKVAGGAPLDEGTSQDMAGQEDVRATPTRGMQEGHVGHGQDHEGAVRSVVPAVRRHASQAGARIRVRVHVPCRGEEARQLHTHNETDADGGKIDRDDP